VGRAAYPHADAVLITADAGGSNGYRSRAWKQELQRLPWKTMYRRIQCTYASSVRRL